MLCVLLWFVKSVRAQFRGACVTKTIKSKFRIGKAGQQAMRFALGLGTPYAWVNIKYTLCCDASGSVEISGSHIPSHAVYIEDNIKYHQDMITDNTLTDLAQFMLSGGAIGASNLAPGGPIVAIDFR